MFFWSHFRLKVSFIPIQREHRVTQGSSTPWLTQTNMLFLADQKLLSLQDCSLECSIFMLHLQTGATREIAQDTEF